MEITRMFKAPLTMQANESIRISNRTQTEPLHSKSEFNHLPIAKIIEIRETFQI